MGYKLLYFILGLVIACKNPSSVDSFRDVPATDTTCLKAIEKAKREIAQGRLSYCQGHKILHISGLRGHWELDSLLLAQGISSDVAYTDIFSSHEKYEGQTQGCYCDFMRYSIDQKYGKKFVDSLTKIADSMFLVNSINDTLYEPSWDTKPNYPTSMDTVDLMNFSATLQEDINESLNYPKGYRATKDPDIDAYADISFIVDKTGQAVIHRFDFYFDLEENLKYKNYFEKIISANYRKTGWTPAKIRNTPVLSEVVLRVYFQ